MTDFVENNNGKGINNGKGDVEDLVRVDEVGFKNSKGKWLKIATKSKKQKKANNEPVRVKMGF